MKTFLDLLDIESYLEITIESNSIKTCFYWPILANLDMACESPSKVVVDGMDVIGFGYWQDRIWRIRHDEPFYRWRHRVTGQGWLLEPITVSVPDCADS